MHASQLVSKLTTADLLDEIHHLLWIEPGENHGKWDEGWNCRDHAWLAGVVCQLFKLTAAVCYGQRQHKLVLRWKNSMTGKWQCETTGTADMTEARELQKLKWAEVNRIVAPPPEPEPVASRPTWQECRDAIERAMRCDTRRPSYIADALSRFNSLKAALPGVESPADITDAQAKEYKRRAQKATRSAASILCRRGRSEVI